MTRCGSGSRRRVARSSSLPSISFVATIRQPRAAFVSGPGKRSDDSRAFRRLDEKFLSSLTCRIASSSCGPTASSIGLKARRCGWLRHGTAPSSLACLDDNADVADEPHSRESPRTLRSYRRPRRRRHGRGVSMIKAPRTDAIPAIMLVQHWDEELRRLVPKQ